MVADISFPNSVFIYLFIYLLLTSSNMSLVTETVNFPQIAHFIFRKISATYLTHPLVVLLRKMVLHEK
jgi:hypothetical protein